MIMKNGKRVVEVFKGNAEIGTIKHGTDTVFNNTSEYVGTLPVTINSVRAENLKSYKFSGNTVQNGTPTPDNPIIPQGTGERTGNLFDKSTADLYNHSTLGQTNTWAYSAESTGVTLRIPCDANTQYTLSIGSTIGNTVFRISEVSTDDVPIEGGSGGIVCHTILNGGAINNYTFTTASDSKYILFQVNANVTTTALNTLMINTGSTALPYEPYGYKIPIALNGATATTLYLNSPLYGTGDVMDKYDSTGKIVRKWGKLVLTGEEDIAMTTTSSFQILGEIQWGSTNGFCTHYQQITWVEAEQATKDGFAARASSGGADRFRICDRSITTVADFRTYLAAQYAAGTPVTVIYQLATPTEEAITAPPLTLSKGTNIVDVDTTVSPSSAYLKWKGYK